MKRRGIKKKKRKKRKRERERERERNGEKESEEDEGKAMSCEVKSRKTGIMMKGGDWYYANEFNNTRR